MFRLTIYRCRFRLADANWQLFRYPETYGAAVDILTTLVEETAYQISIRRTAPLTPEQEQATSSAEHYDDWREGGLKRSFGRHFSPSAIEAKRVLDFGCGAGALSRLAAEMDAAEVTGIDINPRSIERALQLPHDRVKFQLEPDPARISLADNSIDVILSFWMLEHVMTYRESIREWARVLVPGGKVLILWSVWRHPYGHHLHTIVPIPWIHMLLGPAPLLRVAHRVYKSPKFQPRWWHFDESGARIQNFYRGETEYADLNCLTTSVFEQVARDAGLRIARREVFGSTNPARRFLVKFRPLQDFIAAYFIYELIKPQ